MDARTWSAAYDIPKHRAWAQRSLKLRNAASGKTRERAENNYYTAMSLIHHAFATSEWETEAFSRLSGISLHRLRRLQRLACEIA